MDQSDITCVCVQGVRVVCAYIWCCWMFVICLCDCYTSFGKHLSDKIHLLSLSCFCQICHSTTAESLYYFKVFFHCSVNRRIWCYIFNAGRFMPYWNEANLMLPTLGEKYANNDLSTPKKRYFSLSEIIDQNLNHYSLIILPCRIAFI